MMRNTIYTLYIGNVVDKTISEEYTCTIILCIQMRDEKEERKKQARSNKQTRQSNIAHTYAPAYMYM